MNEGPRVAHSPDVPVHPPEPWGPGMTALFGFLVFGAYSVVQGLALLPLALLSARGSADPKQLTQIMTLGVNLMMATAVSCPAMLGLVAMLILLRRGPSLGSYLALNPVRLGLLAGWLGGMLGFILSLSALNDYLGRPVPEFIEHSYATAVHLPAFFLAVGVLAPVAEEVFFRGFVYRGLAGSRLGPGGTILATSVVFMLVHAGQYDWFDLSQVGIVGVLLGVARWRSGSLIPPIAMHVLFNLTSLILYAATRNG